METGSNERGVTLTGTRGARRPLLTTMVAGALLVGASLTGCSPADAGTPGAPGVVAEPSGDAPEATTLDGAALDATAFADLAAQPGVVLLDVRTPGEHADAHIPGSALLDASDPGFAVAVQGLDPNATYAVYCRSGNRSAAALDVMREAGIADTAHLDGGIGAWVAAGGPTTAG